MSKFKYLITKDGQVRAGSILGTSARKAAKNGLAKFDRLTKSTTTHAQRRSERTTLMYGGAVTQDGFELELVEVTDDEG